jgi:hypothetical protein
MEEMIAYLKKRIAILEKTQAHPLWQGRLSEARSILDEAERMAKRQTRRSRKTA